MGHTLPVMVELPSDALTTRTPGESLHRVRVIAAIHAMAEWLAENPDVPIPSHIDFSAHFHGNDYDAQVKRVVDVAAAHDGEVSTQSGDTVRAEIAPVDADGAHVRYILFGSLPPVDLDGILAAAMGQRR